MKTSPFVRLLTSALLASALLAGCSSPTPPAGSLSKHVSLIVGEEGFAFAYKTFAVAGFSEFKEPFTGTLAADPLAAQADTCTVTTGENTDPLAQFQFLAAPVNNAVNIGESVTLNSAGTAYATLPQRDFFGSTLYGSGPTEATIAPPPLPESLTLSVPEGDYSAANGATIAPVGRLELTSPTGDALKAITPQTTFSWAGSSEGAYVGFQVDQANAPGKADDLHVFCLAKDDGDFSFPARTQSEMGRQGFSSGVLMSHGRIKVNYQKKGDTALLLASVRYVVLNLPQP